jgi:GATA-binding protein
MSASAQYGERGGFMHQSKSTHPASTSSNLYDFGTAIHTSSSSSLLSNHNHNSSHDNYNNSHSITEHDYRFPRRPAHDHEQLQHYDPSFSPDSDALYDFESVGGPGIQDKLDFSSPAVGGVGVARKEMLRDTIFPTWKDDSVDAELDSPDEMQKKDPLATQIWRLYSKTKKQLPNQERMENLTWRMMAMNLRKRKQEDAARYVSRLPSTQIN